MKSCVPLADHFPPPLLHSCVAYLILRRRLLRERQYSWDANRQVISAHIEELRVLHELPDLGLFQMIQLILVRRRKIRAERTVMPGDNDAAAAGRSLFVIAVCGLYARLRTNFFQMLAVFVAANAADVDG